MGTYNITNYKTFYKYVSLTLVDIFVNILNNNDSMTLTQNLFKNIIDMQSDDKDFVVSQAIIDIGFTLLYKTYLSLMFLPRDVDRLLPTVQALNVFTKKYIHEDLTDFVNNQVWEGQNIPQEWGFLSNKAGENISMWNFDNDPEIIKNININDILLISYPFNTQGEN